MEHLENLVSKPACTDYVEHIHLYFSISKKVNILKYILAESLNRTSSLSLLSGCFMLNLSTINTCACCSPHLSIFHCSCDAAVAAGVGVKLKMAFSPPVRGLCHVHSSACLHMLSPATSHLLDCVCKGSEHLPQSLQMWRH